MLGRFEDKARAQSSTTGGQRSRLLRSCTLQIIDQAAHVDWQLAGMAGKTLWNYLARLKTAIVEGNADSLIFADQLADLVDLLETLLSMLLLCIAWIWVDRYLTCIALPCLPQVIRPVMKTSGKSSSLNLCQWRCSCNHIWLNVWIKCHPLPD